MAAVKNKPGPPKGTPKPVGSGVKKGQRHKATLLKMQLCSNPNTTQSEHSALMKKIFEIAMCDNSINAASVWFEQHAKMIHQSINMEVESIEDINRVSELITKKMLCRELSIPMADQLHKILLSRKIIKETEMIPLAKKICEQERLENEGLNNS